MPDLRLGNVFQLPSRRISRRWTRSGTNLVIFLEAFCAQTNLFWCEMIKTICILKSNTRQENFHTLDILNAHFYKYAKKVVYQFDFLKMNVLHKAK